MPQIVTREEDSHLDSMCKGDLSEEVSFKSRPEQWEGVSQADGKPGEDLKKEYSGKQERQVPSPGDKSKLSLFKGPKEGQNCQSTVRSPGAGGTVNIDLD